MLMENLPYTIVFLGSFLDFRYYLKNYRKRRNFEWNVYTRLRKLLLKHFFTCLLQKRFSKKKNLFKHIVKPRISTQNL